MIQWLKYTARGYRNRERFRNAIYFHLGGLDLYPRPVRSPFAHATSRCADPREQSADRRLFATKHRGDVSQAVPL